MEAQVGDDGRHIQQNAGQEENQEESPVRYVDEQFEQALLHSLQVTHFSTGIPQYRVALP
jgi:hypothetical protein